MLNLNSFARQAEAVMAMIQELGCDETDKMTFAMQAGFNMGVRAAKAGECDNISLDDINKSLDVKALKKVFEAELKFK